MISITSMDARNCHSIGVNKESKEDKTAKKVSPDIDGLICQLK
jgi:hypothetical protein